MAILGGGERDLTIKLFANVDNFQKNMKSAENGTRDFSGKAIDALGKLGIAVAAAGAAVGAFAIKLGVDSVKAAMEAEKQQARLATILSNTGANEKQIQALNDQAKALGSVGVATRDSVTITQSQLATFDLKAKTIGQLTPAIIDYVIAEKGATASTDDFRSMTNGLAQALNGNFASLTASGFVLDAHTKNLIKNGSETERAAALVEVLNSTYAGFNETISQTAEGQLIKLQNAFNDLKVEIGNALLPFVLELFEAFNKTLLPKIVEFTKYIVEQVVPALEKYLRPQIERLVGNLGNLGKAFDDTTKAIVKTKEGTNIFVAYIKEIAMSVVNGFLNVINFLSVALEKLTRLIGFVVLFAMGQQTKAVEILTGKINEQNSATANAYRELDFYRKQLDTTAASTAAAYRELKFYTDLQNGKTTPAIKEAKTSVDNLKESLDEKTEATNKASEASKKLAAAQVAKKKSVDDTNLSLKQQIQFLREFGGAAFTAAGGAGMKSGAQIQESARSAAEIVSQFGGFISGFNLNPSDPYYGFGQGSRIDTFQRGSGNVNINVTGTVIDPEGAARAIADLLARSGARAGDLNTGDLFGVNP
jgi:hypothetical protein